MSSVLPAWVQGGRLIVEDRVDLPDGEQIHLRIVENEDELDEEDRSVLHRKIILSRAEAAIGPTVSAQGEGGIILVVDAFEARWTREGGYRRLVRDTLIALSDARSVTAASQSQETPRDHVRTAAPSTRG